MSTIPRHSTTPGLLPNLSSLKLGELVINTADKSLWSSDGEKVVKINGANRLEELDGVDDNIGVTELINNNSVLKWRIGEQQWKAAVDCIFGKGSVGDIDTSVSIGDGAVSTVNSISIGKATQSLANGIAVGRGSSSGIGSVSIGEAAVGVNSIDAVAIGQGSSITGEGCISIGKSSSSINGAIALGRAAACLVEYAISIGASSNSQGISIGRQANSTSTSAVAIGLLAVSAAAGAIQLGTGTNSDQDTLQFKNIKIANSRSIQVLYVPTLSFLTSMSPMPPNGTLAMEEGSRTLQMVMQGSWVAAAEAAFDPSTLTLGVIQNVKSAGANGVDGLGVSQDGYAFVWSNSESKWVASEIIGGGIY